MQKTLDYSTLKSYNSFKNLNNNNESGVRNMATLKERVQKGTISKTIKEQKEKEKAKKEKKYRGVYEEVGKGTWGFRLTRKYNGISQDTNRGGFATALQAKKARDDLNYEWAHAKPTEPTTTRDYTKTFQEVFDHYLENRAFTKRESTTRRHLSLWEHHIQPKWGNKRLADISKADIENYLAKLYKDGDEYNGFEKGYKYSYVEGFLKLIWLIYGYAYDKDWLEPERYRKDFENKKTKLSMPPKQDEGEQIEIYNREQIEQIISVMKDGNLYISFLLCYYCGLRISECMGLMWKDFDKTNHELHINRQLLYSQEEKIFYLGQTKTKKSKRKVKVPQKLYDYLIEYKKQQDKDKQSKGYKNTEIVYDRTIKDKEIQIIGGDFIQRKENGELITINSVKYWTDKVKKETNINFHFHALRHTNASILAMQNIPMITLAEHLGHANTNICQKYYATTTEDAKDRLLSALNEL